ncbi:MAG: hypothetical protein QM744_02780 [Mesorhizobium sp.]
MAIAVIRMLIALVGGFLFLAVLQAQYGVKSSDIAMLIVTWGFFFTIPALCALLVVAIVEAALAQQGFRALAILTGPIAGVAISLWMAWRGDDLTLPEFFNPFNLLIMAIAVSWMLSGFILPTPLNAPRQRQ